MGMYSYSSVSYHRIPRFLQLTLLCLALLPINAQSQIITTVAGKNERSYSGDNGPATLAALHTPVDVITDNVGNFYILDGNFCVRKVSSTGIITTIAGTPTVSGFGTGDNGPATAANFSAPRSIALDQKGNLYISDFSDCRIRKVDTAGIITAFAGTGVRGYNGDNIPATAANLYFPSGMTTDKDNNLYICDLYNYRIRKIDTLGIITTVAGTGRAGYLGDGGSATAARIKDLDNIVLDRDGNIYFSEYVRIRKINTAGIISTFAGNNTLGNTGDGGPALNAAITVYDLLIDSANNMYFSDHIYGWIRKINANGAISTVSGTGNCTFNGDNIPFSTAGYCYPKGIAMDRKGDLYIADQNNNRIRKYGRSATGITTTATQVNAMTLYPNPASGSITITLPARITAPIQITITDLLGRLLQRSTYRTEEGAMELNLPTGRYLITATTPTERHQQLLEVIR